VEQTFLTSGRDQNWTLPDRKKRRLKLLLRRKGQLGRKLRGKRKQERLTGRCVN
jgi:hypothetical protein